MKKKNVIASDRPVMSKLDGKGREIPDSTPMEIPVHFQAPMPLNDRIRQMVRSEALRIAAMQTGHETFEQADDFDIGDDYDPKSPYEQNFDQEMEPLPERHDEKMTAMKEDAPEKPLAGPLPQAEAPPAAPAVSQ